MDESKLESIIFGLKATIAEKDKEIERLQGENADLNVKNATLEHENSELKQRVSILEADNDDYKNKIAENELVSIDWHYSQVEDLEEEKMRLGNRLSETQYSLSVCQDVNAEQKAEIERLTEENEYLDGCAKQFLADYQKCEIERAELQKQVDELKEELKQSYKELEKFEDMRNKAIEVCDNCHKKYAQKIRQAVKDTAKEIIEKLDNAFSLYYPHGQIPYSAFQERLKVLAKEKGVEVE